MDARSPGAALVADYEAGVGVEADDPSGLAVADDGQPWLAATLPALDLATGSVQALRRAAGRAGASGPVVDAPLALLRVAAAFSSERLLRLDGHEVAAFAPLSGFFHTVDGWVRTHANYPHHQHRLLAALHLHGGGGGAPALHGVGPEDLTQVLKVLTAQEVEDAAMSARAVAVRVRTEDEWRASAPGAAAAEGPLVLVAPRDERPGHLDGGRPPASGARPLTGVRVLDLTRVVAGPVATRALALLGADVLRVDPPVPAEIRWQHLDTGQGKRTALLDLHDEGDFARAQKLLDEADVLVTGYRPGSVEALGLRVPRGVVHARVSAWGETGPWAGRRGFDSIVQAATGIAIIESLGGEARETARPGVLPAQALDHASGYLLAAGVLDALTARAGDGQGRDVVVSLARTATWLLDAEGRDPQHPPAAAVPLMAAVSHGHAPEVTTARPALPGFDDYSGPAHAWGTDHARWVSA
ncbi:CoA transferase [Xylanimonas sp. McL0601]|uniref:CoA transferase n=1 Tax=Xylanimonas sp. McL0601 TaxID=3414739 RepID=UPI003CFBBF0D